jgi:hypothetical protein
MLDGAEREIDIEVTPTQVSWGWTFDVEDRSDGGVFETRELLEGQEMLLAFDQNPEAVLGNVADLNCRSGAVGISTSCS